MLYREVRHQNTKKTKIRSSNVNIFCLEHFYTIRYNTFSHTFFMLYNISKVSFLCRNPFKNVNKIPWTKWRSVTLAFNVSPTVVEVVLHLHTNLIHIICPHLHPGIPQQIQLRAVISQQSALPRISGATLQPMQAQVNLQAGKYFFIILNNFIRASIDKSDMIKVI